MESKKCEQCNEEMTLMGKKYVGIDCGTFRKAIKKIYQCDKCSKTKYEDV